MAFMPINCIYWIKFQFDIFKIQFYSIPNMLKGTDSNSPLRFLRHIKNNQKIQKDQIGTSSYGPLYPYSDEVYHKFLKILKTQRQKYLKQRLIQYHGKNFPIEYRDHYEFKQRWQNKILAQQRKSDYKPSSLVQLLFIFLTIIVYSLTIWLTNFEFFFNHSANKTLYHYEIYAISLALSFAHFAHKAWECSRQDQNTSKILKIIKRQYLQIITLLYLIIKLCGVDYGINAPGIIFQHYVLLIFYLQASKMYKGLRLTNFSLQYEYQIKMLDMVISVFIIAHFIATILYLTTHLSPQHNWMTSLAIDQSDPYAIYAYSFYFCTTTIMTVGYGDITPKNIYEITVVIMVQIFGVTVLGYIINQIGYCVSSINRGQQLVERDLSVVEKMRKHYKMGADLTHRVRQYIINNKPSVNELSPEEEQEISNKLSQQIRLNVTTQNMISVVKTSIFFLCRWSKQFQNAVSLRLIHTLFNPNDVLYQPNGNQRIYIVKNGKVEITAGKGLNNILKSINNQAEVSDNSYGITSVISTRKTKIYAVSKGFTSAYYIQGEKFKECINEKMADFEYYHQLKNKMDLALQCQSVQLNSLVNTKHHYCPTRRLIIKKQSKRANRQSRKYIIRGEEKTAFRGTKNLCDSSILHQVKNVFVGSYATFAEQSLQKIKLNTVNNINQGLLLPILQNTAEMGTFFQHYFEQSKDYSNYFVRNNKSEVLKRLEKEYLTIHS